MEQIIAKKSPNAVLVVPACERGQGGGHLSRSLLLLRSLRLRGRDAYLWIPGRFKDDFLQRFKEFFTTLDHPCIISCVKDLEGIFWDFIVLDRYRTHEEEFSFWSDYAPLIGIDEGGPYRDKFDFLFDLLPSLSGYKANLDAPGLLPLPKNRRPRDGSSGGILKVLICFGAEDNLGLGQTAACVLSGYVAKNSMAGADADKPNGVKPYEITLVAPILPPDPIPGVRMISKIFHLQEHLCEYDLLISHFGLTAFEAVYARLPVMLISPTAYHEKLSRSSGFFSLGIFGMGGIRRLVTYASHIGSREFLETLMERGEKIARRFGLEEDQKEDLSSFVLGFNIHSPANCPVCGIKSSGPVLARFPTESFRRCPACGMIYLARLYSSPEEYNIDYFFESYKNQYGKTYLEDFPNLVEAGRKRMAIIKEIIAPQGPQSPDKWQFPVPRSLLPNPLLLDIGCAYGPFMAAAAECGFSPYGIDPAEDAVRYVKDELKFPAWQGFFPVPAQAPLEEFRMTDQTNLFDVVSLWYVIEHFTEPGKILSEIYRLLKPGGILAFSTPSYSGISGRKNLRLFLEKSPRDHLSVWAPRKCKNILKQYGFYLKKIHITGIHPERFPLLGRFIDPAKQGFLYRLLFSVSRLFHLGDTFEVYAVKKDDSLQIA